MDVFTMVVIIVTVSCLAGVANNYMKSKARQAEQEVPSDLAAELDELRERIEVLEKIVTDDKFHLTKELDKLERQA